MDIRSTLAAQTYAGARPATQPNAEAGGTGGFAAAFADFASTLRAGEDQALSTMQGDADPHALVMALAQSQLAVETVVAVRDRVVEAYQEILRMPV
jgi:flagellar hook-basal body complex protein FliE